MSRTTHGPTPAGGRTIHAVAGTEPRTRQGHTDYRGVCLDQEACPWRGPWTDQVTALHNARDHRRDSHANRTAVVTFDAPTRDGRGTYTVITRMGHTVVHHTQLTPAERAEVVADPTLAHRRSWGLALTHTQRRSSK